MDRRQLDTALPMVFGLLVVICALWVQGALIPVAYTKGTDFKPAPRADLDAIIHVDTW